MQPCLERSRRDATRNLVLSAAEGTPYAIFAWIGLALLVSLFYLGVAWWSFGVSGFPLDDAWIHQTYARNLARSGQLAFVPGLPSTGSTAPLWTLLLSIGYFLGIPFKLWTYGLGVISLGLTGWSMAQLGRRLFPEQRRVGLWAGLFCLFEWHLVWAAVSGMETILFVWLSLFLFERYLAVESSGPNWRKDVGLGILGGLLILTRPEGLGLAGLIGLDMARRQWQQKEPGVLIALLKRWLAVGAGVGVMLIPYMMFHLQTTGLLFPNTLYAKQAEYAIILNEFPVWWRLFGGLGQPVESVQGVFRVIFIGAQILLLPGLVFAGWLTLKERRWPLLPVWLWWISYLLLYAVRLPVTYQHGRYQIPVIAWVVLLGVWGTARLVSRPKKGRQPMVVRALGRVLVISLIVVAAAFTVIGAQAYGRDVRFIESEMVVTAQWLARQTPPDALIAAHDIGAIGYFAERPLIDLAGLITPEVIPFIRDETALYQFVVANQADYLVTFPSWYPQIVQQSDLIPRHKTNSPWGLNYDNMTVYSLER